LACGDGAADGTFLATAAERIAVGATPHVLGHLSGVVVTDWARLPGVLRARVKSLL
jgi:phosphoserine phosphatase